MTLHDLNTLDHTRLRDTLLTCCASTKWADCMVSKFPEEDLVDILENAEECWYACSNDDWKEAFAAHPEIGNIKTLAEKFRNTTEWASDEQGGVRAASHETIEALAEANRLYREKFGYIFIVCATGKSAEEMLGLLHARLHNEPEKEIRIAADEQFKITRLRIEKLLE